MYAVYEAIPVNMRKLIDGKKLDLSSTSIRHKLKDNIFNDEEIPLKIIQYIKKNSLY